MLHGKIWEGDIFSRFLKRAKYLNVFDTSSPILRKRIWSIVWLLLCPFCTNVGCTEPLGVEDNDISDVQLSASSQWDENHSPKHGRLHMKAKGNSGGCWSALSSDFHQWLQVDLGSDSTVTRVATQGSNEDDQWVSKYRLQYSHSGIIFKFCKTRKNSSAKVILQAFFSERV